MTHVLIFGASHVARLAIAFAKHRAAQALPADLTVDFVSAPGPISGRIKVQGRFLRLLPKPDKWPKLQVPVEKFDTWYDMTAAQMEPLSGPDGIDISTYDAAFYLGGQLLRDWRMFDKSLRQGVFSQACMMQTCADVIRDTTFFRCLSFDPVHGRGCKITAVFEPIQNEVSPDYQAIKDQLGPFAPVHDLYRSAAMALGMELLPFPMQLLNPAGNAVAAQFHSGKMTDVMHLNAAGAHHVLQSILAATPGCHDLSLPPLSAA